MFRRRATWLEARADELLAKINRFDASGPLTALSNSQLLQLIVLIEGANEDCMDLLQEHHHHAPSMLEFSVGAFSGLGGLALLDPSMLSLLVTSAGVLATAIATYNRGHHLLAEQRYLGVFWDIEHRRHLLQSEMARRGITSP
jgi:hypothetical protein